MKNRQQRRRAQLRRAWGRLEKAARLSGNSGRWYVIHELRRRHRREHPRGWREMALW